MQASKSKNRNEVILGIDPGSTTIGYGAISIEQNSRNNIAPTALGYGYIDLKGNKSEDQRLLQLYLDLNDVFKSFKPDVISIERLFFFKNAKTFVSVLQARGVILFTAAKSNIKVYEYTPLAVKQTISGYGKADKNMIQKLVCSTLKIDKPIKPDDASDALAIAICHLRQRI